MQGANSRGRTLVVLSSAMSTPSSSQALTDFMTRSSPFYTEIMCVLHHLEWSYDDITTFHPVITTRIDDITWQPWKIVVGLVHHEPLL